MSNIDSKNFYEVLGVERTADARTVKKAYFALVRKYPPETKPQEFQKLREAYEVLSDENARKDYDSIGFDTRDNATSAQVSLALEAMDEQRYADARKILTELLKEQPGLAFAKDLLGAAYLRDKMFPNAMAIFQSLVTAHPENGAYVLHLGYSQHAQKLFAPAEASFRRAVELSKDDVRPLVALADCMMDQRRWDEALKVLDTAINLDGSVDFRDFALFTRKLEVEAERKNPAGLAAVLAELKKIIPPDEAGRKFVANRLAALAAPLFAQKRPAEANLMMKEAAALDPTRGTGQMPSNFTLEIETLPEASRAWLVAEKNKPSFMKMVHSPRVGPVFALIFVVMALPVLAAVAFGERRPLEAPVMAVLGLATFGLVLLAAWAVLRLRDIGKSPYGKYTTVHPFYLLEVNVDKVTAWPLANLHDVRITHHHTNGVYSASHINLVFSKRTFNTSIYGKEKSVQWADTVLAARRRMLEMMFTGLSEEGNPDASLIPAAMIPDEGKSAPPTPRALERKQRWRKVMLGSAGGSAMLTLALVPLNAHKRDRYDFHQAKYAYRHKVEAYQRYLEKHPSGAFVSEANAAIEALYDDAQKKVAEHGDSEFGEMMKELVKVLREKRSTKVGVRYESKTLFEKMDLSKFPEELARDITDPKPAFTAAQNTARERSITEAIQGAFTTMLGSGVVTIGKDPYESDYDYDSAGRREKKPEVEPPVSFVIKYEVGLTGTLYESATARAGESGKRKFLGIAFFWDFGVKFEGDEALKYEFELDSEPAKDIRWTTYGSAGSRYESPTLPYDKMAESAFDDFRAQLGRRFGVEADTRPRREPHRPPPTPSPVPKKRKF